MQKKMFWRDAGVNALDHFEKYDWWIIEKHLKHLEHIDYRKHMKYSEHMKHMKHMKHLKHIEDLIHMKHMEHIRHMKHINHLKRGDDLSPNIYSNQESQWVRFRGNIVENILLLNFDIKSIIIIQSQWKQWIHVS